MAKSKIRGIAIKALEEDIVLAAKQMIEVEEDLYSNKDEFNAKFCCLICLIGSLRRFLCLTDENAIVYLNNRLSGLPSPVETKEIDYEHMNENSVLQMLRFKSQVDEVLDAYSDLCEFFGEDPEEE